jgi:hypothetical protein
MWFFCDFFTTFPYLIILIFIFIIIIVINLIIKIMKNYIFFPHNNMHLYKYKQKGCYFYATATNDKTHFSTTYRKYKKCSSNEEKDA